MSRNINHPQYFVSDTSSQSGPYILHLDFVANARLIRLCAQTVILLCHPRSKVYDLGVGASAYESSEAEARFFESVMPNVPGARNGRMKIEYGHVYDAKFQLELLIEWARIRNSLPDHLVGEAATDPVLVYTALVIAHDWRIHSIRESIKQSGPTFGSATGWHLNSFTEHVVTWPDRFKFQPERVDPLPGENLDFYSEEIAFWEHKKAQEAESQK